MFTLRARNSIPALLACALLVFAAGCGDDDPTSPGGGGAMVTDEITVTLDQIHVVRDCDGGGGGEFSYKFYVQEYVGGTLVRTHLSESWNSFTGTNGMAWDPNYSTSFQLTRHADSYFKVRVALREFDGSLEHFMRGEFVTHDIKSGQAAWTPTRGNGDVGYDLYDSSKQIGEIEFLADIDSACETSMTYSVSVSPATP